MIVFIGYHHTNMYYVDMVRDPFKPVARQGAPGRSFRKVKPLHQNRRCYFTGFCKKDIRTFIYFEVYTCTVYGYSIIIHIKGGYMYPEEAPRVN